MSPFHALLDIRCIGCDRWGAQCCSACLDAALGAPVRETLDGVPLFALGAYRGPLRELVRAIKFSGTRALIGLLGAGLESLGSRFPGAVAVPIPASREGFVARGFHLTRRIAHLTGLRTEPVLRLEDFGSQRRRRRTDRLRGRAMRITSNALPVGCRVVLVDDVVTTGATLRAAIETCRARGLHVVAAVVLAATPPRETRRDPLPNRPVRV